MSAKETDKLISLIKVMPTRTNNDDFLNFASSGETIPPPTPPITSEPTPPPATTITNKKTQNYLPYILAGAGLLLIIFSKKEK